MTHTSSDRLSNYQTRHVHLWLTKDEETFSNVRERVQLARLVGDPDDDGTLGEIADWLKKHVEELAELVLPGAALGESFVTDLVISALNEVDWYQLAGFYSRSSV